MSIEQNSMPQQPPSIQGAEPAKKGWLSSKIAKRKDAKTEEKITKLESELSKAIDHPESGKIGNHVSKPPSTGFASKITSAVREIWNKSKEAMTSSGYAAELMRLEHNGVAPERTKGLYDKIQTLRKNEIIASKKAAGDKLVTAEKRELTAINEEEAASIPKEKAIKAEEAAIKGEEAAKDKRKATPLSSPIKWLAARKEWKAAGKEGKAARSKRQEAVANWEPFAKARNAAKREREAITLAKEQPIPVKKEEESIYKAAIVNEEAAIVNEEAAIVREEAAIVREDVAIAGQEAALAKLNNSSGDDFSHEEWIAAKKDWNAATQEKENATKERENVTQERVNAAQEKEKATEAVAKALDKEKDKTPPDRESIYKAAIFKEKAAIVKEKAALVKVKVAQVKVKAAQVKVRAAESNADTISYKERTEKIDALIRGEAPKAKIVDRNSPVVDAVMEEGAANDELTAAIAEREAAAEKRNTATEERQAASVAALAVKAQEKAKAPPVYSDKDKESIQKLIKKAMPETISLRSEAHKVNDKIKESIKNGTFQPQFIQDLEKQKQKLENQKQILEKGNKFVNNKEINEQIRGLERTINTLDRSITPLRKITDVNQTQTSPEQSIKGQVLIVKTHLDQAKNYKEGDFSDARTNLIQARRAMVRIKQQIDGSSNSFEKAHLQEKYLKPLEQEFADLRPPVPSIAFKDARESPFHLTEREKSLVSDLSAALSPRAVAEVMKRYSPKMIAEVHDRLQMNALAFSPFSGFGDSSTKTRGSTNDLLGNAAMIKERISLLSQSNAGEIRKHMNSKMDIDPQLHENDIQANVDTRKKNTDYQNIATAAHWLATAKNLDGAGGRALGLENPIQKAGMQYRCWQECTKNLTILREQLKNDRSQDLHNATKKMIGEIQQWRIRQLMQSNPPLFGGSPMGIMSLDQIKVIEERFLMLQDPENRSKLEKQMLKHPESNEKWLTWLKNNPDFSIETNIMKLFGTEPQLDKVVLAQVKQGKFANAQDGIAKVIRLAAQGLDDTRKSERETLEECFKAMEDNVEGNEVLKEMRNNNLVASIYQQVTDNAFQLSVPEMPPLEKASPEASPATTPNLEITGELLDILTVTSDLANNPVDLESITVLEARVKTARNDLEQNKDNFDSDKLQFKKGRLGIAEQRISDAKAALNLKLATEIRSIFDEASEPATPLTDKSITALETRLTEARKSFESLKGSLPDDTVLLRGRMLQTAEQRILNAREALNNPPT